jgi:ABC-type multidrug transport system fused ATPase/permease subunit
MSEPLVECRALDKTFASAVEELCVLKGLDLSIEAGSRVAITGASGCGKSTLVSLVNGTYHPSAGHMLLDRQDVSSLQLSWLRDAIAYVPQDPYLFTGTIRENLLFAAPGADDAALVAALRSVALGPLLDRLPEGLDTSVGEGGKLLSRGEGQRLSIARLLLKNAPIVILDEPTASLDAATQHAVSDVIRTHVQGRTAIVISHQLDVVAQCDRIAVLFEGRVAEYGTHDALLRAGGLYATLHAIQTRSKSADAAA